MQLQALLEEGRKLRLQSRQAAIACFEQCLEEASATDAKPEQAIALTELALDFIETRQAPALERATELLDQAQEIADQISDKNSAPIASLSKAAAQAILFYARGMLTLASPEPEEALSYLQLAYQSYSNQAEEDTEGLCLTDDALGRYYATIGDFAQALSHLERSLSRRKISGSSQLLGVSFKHLGQVYLQMYNLEQAQAAFEKSLDASLDADDTYLRLQSLIGMSQVAIAQEDWNTAEALIEESLQLIEEPLDLDKLATLYQIRAEALLGNRQVIEAQDCIEVEAFPRLEALEDEAGIAIAKRTMGRILRARLLEGLDRLTTESIENAEDYFVDASMIFEEKNMMQEYAKTLYDITCLYNVCEEFKYNRYQYQGKALRSLKLALSALDKVQTDTSYLSHRIENMLDRVIGKLS